MKRLALAIAIVLGAAACSSDQDPGFDQAPSGSSSSTTTPALLEPCPPGGPDETTPVVGCLDEDGTVVHP